MNYFEMFQFIETIQTVDFIFSSIKLSKIIEITDKTYILKLILSDFQNFNFIVLLNLNGIDLVVAHI